LVQENKNKLETQINADQHKPFFQKESFTKEICFSFSTGFLFFEKEKVLRKSV